ncbi:MAG TPA: nucleotidyltransferase domain-containing protein, partial [Egibacteraceae bacterium]
MTAHPRTAPPAVAPALDPGAITAAPGPAWCRAWTARVDQALREWLDRVDVHGGVAVVALGSYARAELCPASDVDLLLLHDGWAKPDLESLVRALCYPLWDAGLSVGHAVRTPKQAVQAASERIDTATALIDRRLVAGDVGLLDELASRTNRWLRRSGAKLLSSLAVADGERHHRAGALPGLLEPDLKSGRGGLRDLHSLR